MISSLLKEGFEVWRRNLRLGIPFLISTTIVFASLFVFALLLVLYIQPDIVDILASGKSVREAKELVDKLLRKVDTIVTVALAYIAFASAVDSFFRAVGIRYCDDALSGEAKLTIALSHGRRRWIHFYAANALFLAAIIVPIYPIYWTLRSLPLSSEAEVLTAVIYVLVYFLVWLLYVSVLMLIYTYVPYAIVLDSLSVIPAFKVAFRVLRRRFATTIVL